MRTRQIAATLVLALALTGAISLTAQSRSAEVEFKAAEQKELVRGDLKGAIKDYERIAKGSNRTLAAQAVLRIAGIHARLGDAEARKVYERVEREFPEQTAAVATARARLGSPAGAADALQSKHPVEFAKGDLPSTAKLSVDGRYLSTLGDNGELVIRDLRTGQTRPVTGTRKERGYEFASFGTFSGDGKQMVYTASGSPMTGSELRVVNLQERGVPRFRKIFSESAIKPWAWTPDDKSILVSVIRDDGTRHLGLVSVADGSYRALKPFAEDPVFLSPDGKYVATDRAAESGSGPRDLVVFAIEGGQQIPRLEHTADDRVMGWSPDSRHLIFSSDRNTGSPALYAQLLANGQPQGVPRLLKKDWAQVYPFAVSSSGALFYRAGATSTATDIRIVTFDFERGQPASPSTLVREERRGSVDSPGWSRDGKFLAYRLLHPGGQRASIIVRSLETGDSREFPLGFDINGGVKWHPDGKSLLISQAGEARDPGVYRVDAATGETTRIGNGVNVAVSPDGTTLYFRQPQPASVGLRDVRIVARTLSSGAERQVIRRPLGPGFTLSPDGRSIAQHFIQAVSDNRMLIVPVDGTAPREVPLPRTNLGFLTWTPDGRSILFGASDTSEVWQVATDGRATRLNFVLEDWRAPGHWAVHPDRRQVAYTSVASVGQQESGLWVLENFLSVLR